jgi:hypothetical protein
MFQLSKTSSLLNYIFFLDSMSDLFLNDFNRRGSFAIEWNLSEVIIALHCICIALERLTKSTNMSVNETGNTGHMSKIALH